MNLDIEKARRALGISGGRGEGYALMLRTCDRGMRSSGGFVWPRSGLVEAPDWRDDRECGGGLHGALWGCGDGSLLSWDDSAMWLVCVVREDEVRDLCGKVKVPRAYVVYAGRREEATACVYEERRGPVIGHQVVEGYRGAAITGDRGAAITGDLGSATAGDGGTATAGDDGTATAGYSGLAMAGDGGTATAGHRGSAMAGDRGTATAGAYGTATAGSCGTAIAGSGGVATAGSYGIATAGDLGTATVSHGGTATAGNEGAATAGDFGTATAGDGGTATAGYRGEICIRWMDRSAARYRTTIGYVGEGGIEPNTPYRCDEHGRLVRA